LAKSKTLQLYRGQAASLPSLAEGEFGYTLDSQELYIGSTNGNTKIAGTDVVATVTALQEQVGASKYAVCSTAAATQIKAVTIPSFLLSVGGEVTVLFQNKDTAGSPKLNVSSTGAIDIRWNGAAVASNLLHGACKFVYDGTYWQVVGDLNTDTNTTYSIMSVAEGTTGTATTARTLSALNLAQIINTAANDIVSQALEEADSDVGIALINVTANIGDSLTCTLGETTLPGTIGASGTFSFALPTIGTWTVTNTTNGRNAAVNVMAYTVNHVYLLPAILQSIAVTTLPQTRYDIGDALDLSGIVVTATWDAIPSTDVTNGCAFSPVNGAALGLGITTVTVTFQGKIATFTVSTVDPVFSNNSIAALQLVSENDIALNNLTAEQIYAKYGWSIGDLITPTGGSNAGEAIPHRIIGFNSRMLSAPMGGRTTAGIELQPVDCYGTHAYDGWYFYPTEVNKYGWDFSYARLVTVPKFRSYFSAAWQAAMKTVDIITHRGNSSPALFTSQDTMYPLAAKEIFGGTATSAGTATANSYLDEFNALSHSAWYSANNAAANRIKRIPAGGAACMWWTRSLFYSNAEYNVMVTSAGANGGSDTTAVKGGSLCFCV
jgi:hypothetical protein